MQWDRKRPLGATDKEGWSDQYSRSGKKKQKAVVAALYRESLLVAVVLVERKRKPELHNKSEVECWRCH